MRNIFLIVVLFISVTLFAQKKHLTLESDVLAYSQGLVPKNLQNLQWISDTDQYVFTENNQIQIKSADGKITRQISLNDFNKAIPILKNLPFIEKIDAKQMVFQNDGVYYVYDYNKNEIIETLDINEESENQDFNDKKNILAYTINNNLFIGNTENSKISVTNESDPNIVSGQSIHRNEFGIYKGTFWSPAGNFLAFYQKDESSVSNYPLEDITTYPSTLKNIKYPMAGQGSEMAKVGIYNISRQHVIYLDIDTKDEHYLTNLSWSPDEKYITLGEVNREQNHMWFNVYDAQTGKFIRTVFEEKNDRWVEPEFAAYFLPKSNTTFLWMSERDGFMNVYQYDLFSDSFKQITNFKFVVTQILGFDPKQENLFLTATGDDPKGLHAFKLNLKKGAVTQLTDVSGTHLVKLSSSANYLIDSYSNLTIPRKVELVALNKMKKTTLLEAENPLKDFHLGTTEFLKLKAEDGQDLEAAMVKPANFNPQKKYPVLIYVYGGPHAQLVTDNWLGGTRLWMQYLAAEKDYIVFTLDNRGSENRGFAFESVIHRNQGKAAMADQLVGVEFLKSLPYVDADRLSVYGWSYGGFMTISLLLNFPDVFTTGVAGGPVTDWKYYEVMYGERYMDTPQENPEGYEKAKLHNKINKLKADLLIIHGSIDETVVPQHSLTLIKEAVEKGIQLDFFTYPMHQHNVRGKDRIHLNQKIVDYILKNNVN